MEVEVLLSTMNLKDINQAKKITKQMNVNTPMLIINQITDNISPWKYDEGCVKVYSYKEKGLSKSRNRAISKASADVEIISDDDVVYEDNYKKIIEEAYKKYKDADIIAFYVQSNDKERSIRKQRTHKVNFITAMRIQSIQITFKRNSIQNSLIKFKEKFGAGSKYFLGEENIFLYECLKEKKKIYYVDEKIGKVNYESSTWFKGFSKEFFCSEGVVFYVISKRFYRILILQYAIRKRKEYKNTIKIKDAIKYMLEGADEYKNNEKRTKS